MCTLKSTIFCTFFSKLFSHTLNSTIKIYINIKALLRALFGDQTIPHREDICQNCEAPFSSEHQFGDGGGGGEVAAVANGSPCTCTNMECCGFRHEPSCECYRISKPDGSDYCDCESISDVACNISNISKAKTDQKLVHQEDDQY